jgi:L-asparaginase
MKHILMILTGGTIGSTVNAGTIDTNSTTQSKLLHLFQQQDTHPEELHFHCLEPIQILSENLAPTVWQTLIAAIEAQQLDHYDGIIITHGTDTLAYTASALSFYFHALKIPLLLVSSDYPLDDERANGLSHFICAVEYIRQHQPSGVFVPYRNRQHTMQVHQGTRLACSLQLSSDFFSVQNKVFMEFDDGQFILHNPILKTAHQTIPLKAEFSSRIMMIKPYPSLDYSHFTLHGVDAVLHDLYHSGTACATDQWGEQHSLVKFIQKCTAQHINVYLAPAIHSEEAYQSTRILIEHGAIMLWNMSIEAAYIKLLLAYGNFKDSQNINEFMAMRLADEYIC